MPCPETAGKELAQADNVAEPETDDEFVNPFDLPPQEETPVELPAVPEALSDDRAACEATTRKAIDVIDAELAADPNGDAKARLDELLVLTRQLRACKSL